MGRNVAASLSQLPQCSLKSSFLASTASFGSQPNTCTDTLTHFCSEPRWDTQAAPLQGDFPHSSLQPPQHSLGMPQSISAL